MCGVGGYSLNERSRVDRTLAAQALLAGIAERGADAVGYAHRAAHDPLVAVHKQRTGASQLLQSVSIPSTAREVLVHVRDYTKGHPRIEANNHPIRHGAVVGIHNGIIENDEEIFDAHGFRRAQAQMTVDSEAIFALAEESGSAPHAFEELHGAMAAAWLDEREPDTLFLARGVGRPLWVGTGNHELFFASTRAALEVVEEALKLRLIKSEISEGRLLRVAEGHVEAHERFRPDASYREQNALPPVRAPREGASCLALLAAIAAAA